MVEICSALERVTWHMRPHLRPLDVEPDATIQELLINIPPGLSKSLITCVIWPAWCWSLDPTIKFIFASWDADLALKDAERMQNILNSRWYRSRWGDLRRSRQTWTKRYFVNRHGGSRLSTSIGGRVIGNHADARVTDDPTKPQSLFGGKDSVHDVLQKPITFLESTLSSRQTDPERSVNVVVMQRLHVGDLAGHMLKRIESSSPKKQKHFCHIRLPMRFNAAHIPKPWESRDWRTVEGELLAPKRYNEESVASLEQALGSLQTRAAQLDQEPISEGGNLFQRVWFKIYSALPMEVRERGRLIQSWDMRFIEDQERGDFVVGQVWAALQADFFLIDEIRGRFSFLETVHAMLRFSERHPKARTKLVENKANGPAIANVLSKKVGGIVLVEPEGGKMARANACTGLAEGGNIYVPSAPWVAETLDEITAFPKARFDDRVDAFTQAIIYLDDKKKTGYSGMYGRL